MKRLFSLRFFHPSISIEFVTVFIFCIGGILLAFVPLEALINFGKIVSPLGTLQDKTTLLIMYIKTVFPVLGVIGILYLGIQGKVRKLGQTFFAHLIASPWTLPVILAISVILRIAWIYLYPAQPYADSIWYFRTASELAAGQGYVISVQTHQPLASWPVGYPAFLALLFIITGPSLWVAKYANIVLSVVCILLTYISAKHIFNRTVALISAFILAVFPGMIVYCSLVETDILFMTLTMLCFTLILKSKQICEHPFFKNKSWLLPIIIGLFSGAASLVRSSGLILFPFWILEKWIVDQRGSACAIVKWSVFAGIGMVAILAPWTVRNYIKFNAFIPVSTNGGVNFWIGNNPNAFGGYMFPKNAKDNPLYPYIGTETVIDKMGYSLGFQFIKENPIRALELLPAKLFYLINSSDFGLHWNKLSAVSANQRGTGNRAFALTDLAYLIMSVVAIIGLIKLLFTKSKALTAWLGVLFTIYWTITCLPFFGQDRFMMPAWPFLAIYAAVGFYILLNIGSRTEINWQGKLLSDPT